MINIRHQRVECFRRNQDGLWVLQHYTAETGSFHLSSVDFSDTLATLDEDVTLEATQPSLTHQHSHNKAKHW